MKPLRVGVIGCGRMGKERALAALALGHQVAWLHDANLAYALELSTAVPGSRVAPRLHDDDWQTLDAVFLCTPPAARIEFLHAFLRARVPFFVEKPISVTADGCATFARELARRPLIHAVGYMNRCRASIQQARMMMPGLQVLGVACHWAGRIYDVPWWLEPALSGGPVNEQATHVIDVCRFLLGEIDLVHAVPSAARRGARETTVAIALRFAAGQIGTLLYTCGLRVKEKQIGVRVLTADGSLDFSGWDFVLTSSLLSEPSPPESDVPIFTIETARFLRAVSDNTPASVACDYQDALRTQLVVDAVREAIRSGQPVHVGNPFRDTPIAMHA